MPFTAHTQPAQRTIKRFAMLVPERSLVVNDRILFINLTTMGIS